MLVNRVVDGQPARGLPPNSRAWQRGMAGQEWGVALTRGTLTCTHARSGCTDVQVAASSPAVSPGRQPSRDATPPPAAVEPLPLGWWGPALSTPPLTPRSAPLQPQGGHCSMSPSLWTPCDAAASPPPPPGQRRGPPRGLAAGGEPARRPRRTRYAQAAAQDARRRVSCGRDSAVRHGTQDNRSAL